MWIYILKTSVLFCLIIYLAEYGWNYLLDNYTKGYEKKDIIKEQTKKYKKIIEELQASQNQMVKPINALNPLNPLDPINALDTLDQTIDIDSNLKIDLKEDLENFMQTLVP